MVATNKRVNMVAREIQNKLADLTQSQHRMAHTFTDALKTKRVQPEYVKETIRHNEWVEQINNQLKRAEQFRDEQQCAYNQLRDTKTTVTGSNATEALLAETRATKQWARIERELSGKPATSALMIFSNKLQDAASRGEQATLAGIASEAPSYLQSIRIQNPDAVVDTIIRTHEPELSAAHAGIGEAEQLIAITRFNTNTTIKGFEQGFRASNFGHQPDQLPEANYIINGPENNGLSQTGMAQNFGALITEEEPEAKHSKFDGKPIRLPHVTEEAVAE